MLWWEGQHVLDRISGDSFIYIILFCHIFNGIRSMRFNQISCLQIWTVRCAFPPCVIICNIPDVFKLFLCVWITFKCWLSNEHLLGVASKLLAVETTILCSWTMETGIYLLKSHRSMLGYEATSSCLSPENIIHVIFVDSPYPQPDNATGENNVPLLCRVSDNVCKVVVFSIAFSGVTLV